MSSPFDWPASQQITDMYAILERGREREVEALADAALVDAGTTREELRKVWDHRCATALLVVAMAIVEGQEVPLPREGHDDFTQEIAALAAIRNAVVHNEGRIGQNEDADALRKVTMFHDRMSRGDLLWSGFGADGNALVAVRAEYWAMDGDMAVSRSSAFDRIFGLMLDVLGHQDALVRHGS
jgi:hypothetical protein